MRHHPQQRRGAALIIALVILAALMLLGLPLLFTQSASLSGARRFEALQAARIYESSARNLGIATALYAVRDNFSTAGTTAAIRLAKDLPIGPWWSGSIVPTTDLGIDGVAIDLTTALGGSASQAAGVGALSSEMGLQLACEGGKLDANSLGPKGWAWVLNKAGVRDWDDNDSAATIPPIYNEPTSYDPDTIGQLAQGLAEGFSESGPVKPYRTLTDLMRVSAAYNHDAYTGAIRPPIQVRQSLDASELTAISRYVTCDLPAVGARGTLSIGSVVATRSTTTADGVTSFTFWDDRMAGTGLASELRTIGGSLVPDDAIIAISTLGEVKTGYIQGSGLQTRSTQPLNAGTLSIGDGFFRTLAPPTASASADPTTDLFPSISAAANLSELLLSDPASASALSPYPLLGAWHGTGNTAGSRAPVDLTGTPVFRLRSSSAIHDRSAAIAAQQRSEVVMQIVPEHDDLEFHWATQSEAEFPLAHGWTNRMATWPNPTNRVPVSSMVPATSAVVSGQPLWVTRPLATEGLFNPLPPHLNSLLRWNSTFTGSIAPVDDTTSVGPAMGADVVDHGHLPDPTTDLHPDGWHLTAGKSIAIRATTSSALVEGNADVMSPTHLSFWFQLPQAPSGVMTLAELRSIRVGKQLDGTAGTNDDQNHLIVSYDHGAHLLILAMAPPTIPAPATGAALETGTATAPAFSIPTVPPEIGTNPANDTYDWRSIAGAGYLPLFLPWQNPDSVKGLNPALAANHLACLNWVGDSGLQQGRWYHLHAMIGSGGPDDLTIWLDGQVGRDVTAIPEGSPYTAHPGDRCWWPALILDNALPRFTPPATVDDTTLRPLVSATVAAHVPAFLKDRLGTLPTMEAFLPYDTKRKNGRGIIRIGNEYLRYEQVSANGGATSGSWTFAGCHRGIRQNSNSSQRTAAPPQAWPGTDDHPAGALIIPGGFSARPGGTIWQGGSTLDTVRLPQTIGTDWNSYQWRVAVDTTTGSPGTTTLNLKSDPTDWPVKGIAWYSAPFGNGYIGFTRVGATLTIVPFVPVNGNNPILELGWPANENLFIHCISLPLVGDPTGRFPMTNREVQIRGPDGAIEWLTYHQIMTLNSTPDSFHLVNFSGWIDSQRGRSRTYPRICQGGDQLMPVQDQAINGLDGGDVVTFLPGMANTDGLPFQAVVRFMACDGFGADPHDTRGGTAIFAFDSPLPIPTFNLGNDTYSAMIVGNGLNSRIDLSSVAPQTQGLTARPWTSLASTAAAIRDQARLILGGGDTDRGADASTSKGMVIDAALTTRISSCVAFPGTGTSIPAGTAALGTTLTLSSWRNQTTDTPVLALIDGEVFVLGVSGTTATIIARGLLSSDGASDSERMPIHAVGSEGWQVTVLPIGPVRMIQADGTTTHVDEAPDAKDPTKGWISLVDGNGKLAPYAAMPQLLVSPDGAHQEIAVGVLDMNQDSPSRVKITIPPWLRGLYNGSADSTFAAPPAAGSHIAIAWWPRFPSALPASMPTATTAAALARCRFIPWVGVAAGLHGLRMNSIAKPTAPTTPAIDVTMTDPLFRPLAVWMTGAVAGLDTGTQAIRANGAYADWSQLFGSTATSFPSDWATKPITGIELRVYPQYTTATSNTLEAMTRAGNTPFAVGTIRFQGTAPITSLTVESVR